MFLISPLTVSRAHCTWPISWPFAVGNLVPVSWYLLRPLTLLENTLFPVGLIHLNSTQKDMCLFFELVDAHSVASKGRISKDYKKTQEWNSFATVSVNIQAAKGNWGLLWTEAGPRGMGLRKWYVSLNLVIVVRKTQSPLHLKGWVQLVCTRVRHKKGSVEIYVSIT